MEATIVKRGRPPQFDRDAVEEQLMGLFWERGYEGVSQQQMVETTGLSSSSLFNTFGTKPAIYEGVMRRYLRIIATLLEPLERGYQGLGDIDVFLHGVAEMIDGPLGVNGCLGVHAMLDPSCGSERAVSLAREYRVRLRDALAAVLHRAKERGEPVPAPETGAALLLAILHGIQISGRLARDRTEPRTQLAAAYALVASWRD
jgi:AcrR family transcriptional regulator